MKTKWLVPTYETAFGTQLLHGINHGLLLVLYRGNHGWKAGEGVLAHASLTGQIYAENVSALTPENPREIVVVNLRGPEWVTLWARDHGDITYPLPESAGTT